MVVETPRRGRAGLILTLGVLVLIIDGYDLFLLGAVGPALLHDPAWGVSRAALGALGSVTAIGSALGAVVAGWSGDVLGRRLPMTASIAWVAVAMVLSAVAPSLTVFGLCRLATGLGIGALIPLVLAVVVETVAPVRHTLSVGVAMTGIALGGLAAAFAARALLGSTPFQTLFLLGGTAIVLVPAVWWLVPAATPSPDPTPTAATEAPRPAAGNRLATLLAGGHRRATLCFWAATFLGLVVVYGAGTWLPTLLVNAGYDLSSSLEFVIVFNAGAIVGTLGATALADRGGLRAITVGSALLAGVAMVVLAAPQARWLVLVMCAAAGLGSLGTQNLVNAFIARHHEPRLRGTALGFSLGIGRLGGIAGPIYLSLVTVLFTSPRAGFYAFVVPAVLIAVVVALVPRRAADRTAATTATATAAA